jgi:hypothetical protein
MKKLKKDDLYKNLNGFLKEKGVELTDGAYASRLRRGCAILTDTINFTQANLEKAKSRMDQKLDRMRQIIHEKTAPKTPPGGKSPKARGGGKKAKAAPAKKAAPGKKPPAASSA